MTAPYTPRNAFAYQELVTSDVATGRLVALALTLEVEPAFNELYGRSHAFYSIAHTQAAAIEFILSRTDDERRGVAARALAMAGHTLDSIPGDVAVKE